MISVEVRNFQSIGHASIQIEGFTAFVGRSNIGKSAFVRAIKAALTNELGTYFVRHDRSTCARVKGSKTCKCSTEVRIKRGTEFDLLWQKGDAINRYTFNGTVYDKPGQGIPEFLLKSGLAPVKIGDDWETLQVADQFYPIFLLNQTGTAAAEAISDVARLDKISAAMKLADKDKREVQATRKVRGQDVIALEAKLSTYEGLDTACAKADGVEATLVAVEACTGRLDALAGYIDATQGLVVEVKGLADVVRVQVPAFADVEEAWREVETLAHYHEQLLEVGGEYRRLLAVKVGDVPPVEPLTDGLGQIRQFNGWLGKLRAFRGAFDAMSDVESMTVPVINPVVDLHSKAKTLSGYETRLTAILSAMKRMEKEMKDLDAEEVEVKEQVDEAGVCPTCSQPVAGHAHA